MISDEVARHFKRKEIFPSLTDWSRNLNELYATFPLLRALIVESIDIKESPSLDYDRIRNGLYKQLGIAYAIKSGTTSNEPSVTITLTNDAVNFNSLPMTVANMAKQAIREGKICSVNSSEDKALFSAVDATLKEISQFHYMNKLFTHRSMGFGAEALVMDAYRLWGWAADIANLCNSFLPVFEKLMKKEVFIFPELDKDLKETIAAANSLQVYLQSQSQSLESKDLTLDAADKGVGEAIKKVDITNPNGGVLSKVGAHILPGDALIKTENHIIRMPELETPSWTITKIFVSPGDTLAEGTRIVTVSSLNIRVEQGRFMKLFQDVYRHLGRVRQKAVYLKEAIEEEQRVGVSTEVAGESKFKAEPERFAALETLPHIEKTAKELNLNEEETSELTKKIRRARQKLK